MMTRIFAALAFAGLGGLVFWKWRNTPVLPAKTAPVPYAVPPGSDEEAAQRFENPPKFLADPLKLLKGQRYRMRYTDSSNYPLNFEGMGFSDVKRYPNAQSLPPDWPAVTRETTEANTVWASGVWSQGAPTSSVVRPPGLWQIWPTAQKS